MASILAPNMHFAKTGSYSVVETCRSEIEFEGDSKGFEGGTSVRGADGVLYLLGLCEGNFCSESRGKEVGNGRVVVMARADDPHGGCIRLLQRKVADTYNMGAPARSQKRPLASSHPGPLWLRPPRSPARTLAPEQASC